MDQTNVPPVGEQKIITISRKKIIWTLVIIAIIAIIGYAIINWLGGVYGTSDHGDTFGLTPNDADYESLLNP